MFEKKRVNVNGYMIDVQQKVIPSAPSVVFIHGLGVSGRYFMPLARCMSATHSVYVIDLPGYGGTPKPTAVLDIKQLAKVVGGFVSQYRLDQPVLVGQSMGCQVVAQLIARKPDIYPKAVLIGPTVNRKERNRFMQALRLFQDVFVEPFYANKIVFADYLRMGVTRYVQSSSYMIDNHIEKNLRIFAGELVVIRGKKDWIAPNDWCRFLVQIARRATFCEIAGAGHLAHYTYANKVGDICERFSK